MNRKQKSRLTEKPIFLSVRTKLNSSYIKVKARHYSICKLSCRFIQLGSWVHIVNLVGRTLLYGPLKFKVGYVAKLFGDLSPIALNFHSK